MHCYWSQQVAVPWNIAMENRRRKSFRKPCFWKFWAFISCSWLLSLFPGQIWGCVPEARTWPAVWGTKDKEELQMTYLRWNVRWWDAKIINNLKGVCENHVARGNSFDGEYPDNQLWGNIWEGMGKIEIFQLWSCQAARNNGN